jgi:transcriptional regulator with GAF, ATPase, and Fis domain
VSQSLADLEGTGLEVLDLETAKGFAARHLHVHDVAQQMEAMQKLAQAFVENPETILQELVKAAVDLCDAESAGISLQKHDDGGEASYQWVATAGKYAHFLNAVLPSFPSACGVCIERGRPQLFRVSQRFFDLMGVDAPTVTDGLLIPWQADETSGTIWIMAHGREEAFDKQDCRLMQLLANFAAMAVRQERQQKALRKQAEIAAAAQMANELAHRINNPLQSIVNLVYMAEQGHGGNDAKTFATEMSGDVERLSGLVQKLLALPIDQQRASH